MIQIYHGNAKGKTTAAIGQAIRASGHDFTVLLTQFLKDFSSGEIKVLKSIANVEVYDKYEIKKFVFTMSDEEKANAKADMQALFDEVTKKAVAENFDVLVLDELLDAISLELVDEAEVLKFSQEAPKNMEIILTGRNPSEALCEIADYITHMQVEKHPYDSGIKARKGIEY